MVKINNISITGLRGVRQNLSVPLNSKSLLMYGDNGSGKSSISDVFEWFYYDRIDHLAGEEIGRKGYEALRNIFLSNDEPGLLKLSFTNTDFNGQRTIEVKNKKLKAAYSNNSSVFTDYIDTSQSENLVLRYKDLVTFVLSTKSDKLNALSDIIGYSQVTNTRDTFLKVLNRLSKEIRTKNFDNQISHQQSQIIEQFAQNVTSDKQFLTIVNELVKPFSLDVKIDNLKDVNEVLKKIKAPDNSKVIKQETFLVKIKECLVNLPINLDELENQFLEYSGNFNSIVSDVEKLKKLAIEKLLTAGQEILSGEDYIDDQCPLCLDEKKKDELLSDVNFRITELKEIKRDKKSLNESKVVLQQQITRTLRLLQSLLDDKQINEEENANYKKNIETLTNEVKKYQEILKEAIADGNTLKDLDQFKVNHDTIKNIEIECESQLKVIRDARKKDTKSEIYGKVKISTHAYAQIIKLKDQKAAYENQRDTMDEIYRQFLKKQKDALDAFLGNFSVRIDEIYQFLNPGEKVENFQLVPITRDDELSGITIQFDFQESKDVTPPHKYLSESHLNCLGIAFFLTSVEAFNRQNRFFVLDDVISSFDVNHRKRFADLLIEKYEDYQIILLTHERTWFDIVKNRVRSKNWIVNNLKHSEIKGTYIDDAPQSLKERVVQKILDKDENNLGNDSRKYLEYLLKIIAKNLEVKVPFRFNDVNEDRMAFELLTELKSTIKKRKCKELLSNPIIDRLLGSLFIGNKDSHDSTTAPKFSDMEAFWLDVTNFEKLFFCEDCKSALTLRNYDKVNKKIRCNKEELSYSWKL